MSELATSFGRLAANHLWRSTGISGPVFPRNPFSCLGP
jgi:hypothetical protein